MSYQNIYKSNGVFVQLKWQKPRVNVFERSRSNMTNSRTCNKCKCEFDGKKKEEEKKKKEDLAGATPI